MIDERRLVDLAIRLVSTPSFTGSEEAAAQLVRDELALLRHLSEVRALAAEKGPDRLPIRDGGLGGLELREQIHPLAIHDLLRL
jgi:hypothetical protein